MTIINKGETLMTSASQLIAQQAELFIPGGVNSATRRVGAPWAFKSAHGATVVDMDGRSYLDYHAAFGGILLGHANETVNNHIQTAMKDMDLVGWGTTELELEAAKLIVEAIPSAEMTISTMSGSEAVFQAIRLARGVTRRPYIVKFQGCFHGSYDAVARNVISTPERAYQLDALSEGILEDSLEHTLIAEFNDLASVEELFLRYPEQIAAIILEPVPHNVGTLIPDQEFLQGLRHLTTNSGALLIFDEVITGFRHALGGYQEICRITPDLTTFGKAMGNGFPVAGLAGSRELMNHFSSSGGPVMLAGTFNGNSISMAAAIATITTLADPAVGFYDHVYALGDRMRSGMQTITTDLSIPAVVSGMGSIFVTYFMEGQVRGYRDLLRNNDKAYAQFHQGMLEKGFLMYPVSLKRNHISLAHTAADIDRTLEAAETVLREMAKDGAFVSPSIRK